MIMTREYKRTIEDITRDLLRRRATNDLPEHVYYTVYGLTFDFERVCDWDIRESYDDCVDNEGNLTEFAPVGMWAGWVDEEIDKLLEADFSNADVETFNDNRYYATLYRISIEETNSAEEFWTSRAQNLWDSLDVVKRDEYNVWFETEEEAKAALDCFKALPNWDRDDYDQYAPHPLIDCVYDDDVTSWND